jgi:primase-polymerase (primpol)-like protein
LPSGEIAEWAEATLRAFGGTYGEISPSGTGVKFIAKGRLPGDGFRRAGLGPMGDGAIECYDCKRYFTVTGQRWGDATDIIELPAGIEFLWRTIKPQERPQEPQEGPRRKAGLNGHSIVDPAPSGRLDASGLALVRRAMRSKGGDLFARLWRGDWKGYYPSRSEADMALMGMLAFWTGKDAARMQVLFSASALGRRSKWRHRADYRQWTIGQAIAGCSNTYDPRRR